VSSRSRPWDPVTTTLLLSTRVPALLGGESPDWAREGTERIRDAFPDARIAVLPGEGHAAIMTAPELVAHEVTRFLAE
jgi:pimeloyl-ACP methyl ester carboxylesterase